MSKPKKDDENVVKELGENFRKACEKAGMTQTEVADATELNTNGSSLEESSRSGPFVAVCCM